MSDLVFAGESHEFFAPTQFDLIDSLISQYNGVKERIETIAGMVTGEIAGAMSYFLDGNGRDQRSGVPSVEKLFDKTGAVAALNSSYWSKAMQLTDVLNYMPQKRRDEWNTSIREQTCPDFEDETVRSTLQSLISMRSQFLAERVDGIFRGLSGEHVTNSPAAFGKRMIVSRVLSSFDYPDHSTCGLINDLRCVIAKFMGRDEPHYSASEGLIRTLKGRWGEWVRIDGGALKIRLYKKGTAHLEVHPDMAWRLNSILANLYPMAIPPEFRKKPARKAKEIDLIQRPLPFSVIHILAATKPACRLVKQEGNWRDPYRRESIRNAIQFGHYGEDKHAVSEAKDVLASIGGVWNKEGWWQFDYNPEDVIDSIVASGCVPDKKAHQFYPTPEKIAQRAVEIAAIELHHQCLEPSAGIASIADLIPGALCVEVSELRCDVLRAKGHQTVCADFIQWAEKSNQLFDRIVMNPPFDRGQWRAHLEAAAKLLKPQGRLVAILPTSAEKIELDGFNSWCPQHFDNEFAGTSISVVILVVERKTA